MRIMIGNTDRDGFVVSISTDEMANLLGHYSGHSMYRDGKLNLRVGDEVKVSKMYGQLLSLAVNQGKLREMATQLMDHARVILTIPYPKIVVGTNEELERHTPIDPCEGCSVPP